MGIKKKELRDLRHDFESDVIKNFLYGKVQIIISAPLIAKHSYDEVACK